MRMSFSEKVKEIRGGLFSTIALGDGELETREVCPYTA
jgi:hypothetical protein